ncbi:MAG: SDR family NAD(P)-dependent oxidoreductase [Pseudomonadota bacterium]
MAPLDLSGKNALVTGGSSGIGFEVAKALLTLGANVTVTGRDIRKLELARDYLVKDTKRTGVTIVQSDFAELDQVNTLASAISNIDLLIDNAGLIRRTKSMTKDGFELQWQVNVLAPMLLIGCLKSMLSQDGRIVNVASQAHTRGVLDLDDLDFSKRSYSGWAAYSQSKLALIMLTRALTNHAGRDAPVINSAHPGLVRTDFARETGWIGLLFNAFKPFYISPRRGAKTILHAAVSPFAAGSHGEYFVRCAPRLPAKTARDDDKCQALLVKVSKQINVPMETWQASPPPA